jgi:hypothetical protein
MCGMRNENSKIIESYDRNWEAKYRDGKTRIKRKQLAIRRMIVENPNMK